MIRVDGIRREALVWTLGGLIMVFVSLSQRGSCLSDDSFQYLSTADNMVKGRGISTSLIHFDEQHYTGKVPASQTVFPHGYPSAVALLVLLGVPLELAGLSVSVASAVILIPVFLWGGILLNIRTWVLRCLMLLLIVNSAFAFYASSILSESLFTLMSLLALNLFLRAEVAKRRRDNEGVYLFLGGVALGLGCWVRYAGLFFVAAILLYFGLKCLGRRDWRAFKSLVLAGSCIPFVLINFLRNLALSGSLMGGNNKHVTNSLTYLIRGFIYSVIHLVLGLQPLRKPGITALLLGVVLAVLTVAALIAVYYVVRSRVDIIRYLLRPPVLLAGVYLGLYLCGLIYAGRTTVISFGDPRMLYPICPIALLLLGGVSSNLPEWSSAVPSRRFGYAPLAVGVVCYSLLHSKNMVTAPRSDSYFHMIRHATSEPIGDSGSLGDWLRAHTPAHQPIMAGDGQACGYLTRRETISLVGTHYSSATWTEDRIRKTAERYGVSVLILFPNGDESRQVAAESPFINDLLQDALPPWIILETQSRDIKVYRLLRRPGATGGSS